MFKENFNSKQQGNVGIGLAIAYFTKIGMTVSIPLNDSQDYDLVVEDNKELLRVQVKTTKFKKSQKSYTVCLKSSGGTCGKVYKTVAQSNCDVLFVICEDGSMYSFPKSFIKDTKDSLTLGDKVENFKVSLI